MKFQRILALTDLSANSIAGLDLAEGLAQRLRAQVTVGYVHTGCDALRDFAPDNENARRLADWVRRDDEERLRELCAEHIAALHRLSTETVEAASAREGVPDLIQRADPDLVCMATRGRTGLTHLLLGSIAEHTIRTAGVPVIVTRGAQLPAIDEPLRVLVALDLIDEPNYLSDRCASFLTEKDELILAHVVESWYYSPSAYGSEFALPQPDVPALKSAAEARMAKITLPEDGPRLTLAIGSGRPGEGLLGLETEYRPHIVVARTHGRRGFDAMMLGSVSEYLARKCNSAVLIYPKRTVL